MGNLIRITTLIFLALNILASNAYSADYMPLKKGTIKEFSWIQDEIWGDKNILYTTDKKEGTYSRKIALDSYKIGEQETIPIHYTYENTNIIRYVIENEEGYFIYADQKPSDLEPQIRNEKEVFGLKKPIKIGTSWKQKYRKKIHGEIFEFKMDAEIDKMDELVVVPVGAYENCMRVKYYGELEFTEDDKKVSLELYTYYAPNLGFIKYNEKATYSDSVSYADRVSHKYSHTNIIQLTKITK
jgi:hypothetical protein